MGTLAERAFSGGSLALAWEEVRRDKTMPPGSGMARFAAQSGDRLAQLVEQLRCGDYRPDPLSALVLAVDGRARELHLPSVRDRVVERAILDAVTPLVDPELGPSAYGYRPGLGVSDAVEAVRQLRDEGHPWVLRADVDDCFPSVPLDLALELLAARIADDDVMAVVRALGVRVASDPFGRVRTVRGLPMGCALSPLLMNLVLCGMDEALHGEGYPLVRYADDFVIAATSRQDATEAREVAVAALSQAGMSLDVAKSQVTTFDDGFTFVGEDFGPRYPTPAATTSQVPDRCVVYVGTQGSRVRVSRGRLIVETLDDKQLLNIPQSKVARLVCFGSVGLTAGMREWSLRSGVEVYLATRRGSYLGQLVASQRSPRVERIRLQLEFEIRPEALELATAVVLAKLRKQVVLLQRFGRRAHRDIVKGAVATLRELCDAAPQSASRQELMGHEGAGARAYFGALGRLVPEAMQFEGRSRRPPADVVNAALSWGYTLLLGECETALMAAGLDPGVGVLHAVDGQRPSLALDLMEEFRVLVVDQCVIQAVRSGALDPSHGRSEPAKPGVLLTKEGQRVVIDAYERRMLDVTRGALPGFGGTLRRHLYRQAQRFAAVIGRRETTWTGLSWR